MAEKDIEEFFDFDTLKKLLHTNTISRFCSNLTHFVQINGQFHIQLEDIKNPEGLNENSFMNVDGFLSFNKKKSIERSKFVPVFDVLKNNHCFINGVLCDENTTIAFREDFIVLWSAMARVNDDFSPGRDMSSLLNNDKNSTSIKYYFTQTEVLANCRKYGVENEIEIVAKSSNLSSTLFFIEQALKALSKKRKTKNYSLFSIVFKSMAENGYKTNTPIKFAEFYQYIIENDIVLIKESSINSVKFNYYSSEEEQNIETVLEKETLRGAYDKFIKANFAAPMPL